MNFKVYGPFLLDADSDEGGFARWIDQPEIDKFWENVKSKHEKLEDACGVYIFSVEGKLKNKKTPSMVPWYVGKAENQTFKQECFSHRNQLSYNKVILQLYTEVTAINFYFLARHDGHADNSKFSAPAKKQDGTVYEGVQFVERLFMQKSLVKNDQLLNIQGLADARGTHIKNILNWPVSGKDDNSVSLLKDSLQIKHHVSLLEDMAKSKGSEFYSVYGPYEFPTYKGSIKKADNDFISKFWDQFSSGPDLPNATGIYIIGVLNRQKMTPYYIGTSKKTSYKHACFHSPLLIDSILGKHGKPAVFFLPRVSDKSDQNIIKAKRGAAASMKFVEKWLLGYGIVQYSDITTDEGVTAKIIRDLYIEGFINHQGKNKGKK